MHVCPAVMLYGLQQQARLRAIGAPVGQLGFYKLLGSWAFCKAIFFSFFLGSEPVGFAAWLCSTKLQFLMWMSAHGKGLKTGLKVLLSSICMVLSQLCPFVSALSFFPTIRIRILGSAFSDSRQTVGPVSICTFTA